MRSFIESALLPSTSIVPESGEMIDMIMRIVVLFPAPLGPRNPQSDRSGISSETPFTACTAPKRFDTFVMVTAARVEFFGGTDATASGETRVIRRVYRPLRVSWNVPTR